MEPSGLANSQSTPAGLRPASRARSIAASVWPRRASTPPGSARRGKTWPGLARSRGRQSSATAVLTVVTRSTAETPVVTPLARFDRDRVGRAQARGVVGDHLRQVQAPQLVFGHAKADDAAALADQKGHLLHGQGLGGEDYVTLVFPILVVDDENALTAAQLGDRPLHAPDGISEGGKRRSLVCDLIHGCHLTSQAAKQNQGVVGKRAGTAATTRRSTARRSGHRGSSNSSSPIRTVTVGSGLSPDLLTPPMNSAGARGLPSLVSRDTAGREFHPALRTSAFGFKTSPQETGKTYP